MIFVCICKPFQSTKLFEAHFKLNILWSYPRFLRVLGLERPWVKTFMEVMDSKAEAFPFTLLANYSPAQPLFYIWDCQRSRSSCFFCSSHPTIFSLLVKLSIYKQQKVGKGAGMESVPLQRCCIKTWSSFTDILKTRGPECPEVLTWSP